MMIAALLFAGCKKKEDPTANNKVGIMNEMVRYIDLTRVEISGTYSYLTSLDAIYVLVGTSNDMSDAMAFESVLSGKSFTADVTGLKENTNYYYRYRFVSMGTEQEQETVKSFTTTYVDLDLPSGLLWATCNVGADSPEDYGWYFMWGSVTEGGDPNCSWANCPGNGGSSDYNATAFSTWRATHLTNNVLSPEVDAAHVNWGGGWRMPTEEEWRELYDNTTSTCTTENGVDGRKFTSKTDSSKYIFLPAAGNRGGTSLYSAGSYGYYWASSLNSSDPSKAYVMLLFSGGVSPQSNFNRCNGCTVRPVR